MQEQIVETLEQQLECRQLGAEFIGRIERGQRPR
jgi:hypothetical protein